jgi:hypothetical protein
LHLLVLHYAHHLDPPVVFDVIAVLSLGLVAQIGDFYWSTKIIFKDRVQHLLQRRFHGIFLLDYECFFIGGIMVFGQTIGIGRSGNVVVNNTPHITHHQSIIVQVTIDRIMTHFLAMISKIG